MAAQKGRADPAGMAAGVSVGLQLRGPSNLPELAVFVDIIGRGTFGDAEAGHACRRRVFAVGRSENARAKSQNTAVPSADESEAPFRGTQCRTEIILWRQRRAGQDQRVDQLPPAQSFQSKNGDAAPPL